MYTVISSKYSNTLTSSFSICIPLISFCCLIFLAQTPSTILNRHREIGQLCLAPGFSGVALSFSPFNQMLAGLFLFLFLLLLQTAFIMVSHVPCIPDITKIFIMKRCWILSKIFLTSKEMTMWCLENFQESIRMA